ncbi:hypothetical protein PVAP13_3KG289727 [Panicum virgatum]|uniref:Uncharacterized protein n=1 Tax=Panicum virgatum TaxID=38727 RepID=A0A8T0V0Z6_PANVG|nr:hypothetical protein PVAP13_3KG289727 [Panicum virgatum]
MRGPRRERRRARVRGVPSAAEPRGRRRDQEVHGGRCRGRAGARVALAGRRHGRRGANPVDGVTRRHRLQGERLCQGGRDPGRRRRVPRPRARPVLPDPLLSAPFFSSSLRHQAPTRTSSQLAHTPFAQTQNANACDGHGVAHGSQPL